MQVPVEVLAPASLELLGELNRFHGNLVSEKDFCETLQNRRLGLEQAQQQFLPNLPISAEGDAGEQQRQSVNTLQETLSDMAVVIDDMLAYASSRDEEEYERLVATLGQILQVERAAIDAYNQANVPNGPTDMPFVNAIYHAQEQFFSGKIKEVTLKYTIDSIIGKINDACAEIEARENIDADAKGDLLYAYQSFKKSLETVKNAIPEGESSVKALMDDVVQKAQGVRDSIKLYAFQATTAGPTKMLQANLMINMCDAWRDGRLEADVFLKALDIFQDNLDKSWREGRAIASLPHESKEIEELMPRLEASYEAQLSAVELFRQGVAGDAAALENAYSTMIEGANQAYDCKVAFEALSENFGKMPCMRCGTYNVAGMRTCIQCGALLLNSVDSEDASTISYQEDGHSGDNNDLVITPALSHLFKAIEQFSEGYTESEEFLASLDAFQKKMESDFPVESLCNELMQEAQIGMDCSDLPQRVDAIRDGLNDALQGVFAGVDSMRQYAADLDSHELWDGARAIRESSLKLQMLVGKMKVLMEGKSATPAPKSSVESSASAEAESACKEFDGLDAGQDENSSMGFTL